jgi:hypothetical protein
MVAVPVGKDLVSYVHNLVGIEQSRLRDHVHIGRGPWIDYVRLQQRSSTWHDHADDRFVHDDNLGSDQCTTADHDLHGKLGRQSNNPRVSNADVLLPVHVVISHLVRLQWLRWRIRLANIHAIQRVASFHAAKHRQHTEPRASNRKQPSVVWLVRRQQLRRQLWIPAYCRWLRCRI